MQSRAVSPGFSPKKSQVMRAELSIRLFSTIRGLGLPVGSAGVYQNAGVVVVPFGKKFVQFHKGNVSEINH